MPPMPPGERAGAETAGWGLQAHGIQLPSPCDLGVLLTPNSVLPEMISWATGSPEPSKVLGLSWGVGQMVGTEVAADLAVALLNPASPY